MIPLSEDKRGTKMSITLNESDIAGEASQWNFTKTIQTTLEDIEIDANFAWLLFSLLVAMVWFIYITHYSARYESLYNQHFTSKVFITATFFTCTG